MKIAISSGHGKYVRGASGSPVPPQLDEVNEARRVVETTADYLRSVDVGVVTFHDNTSHDQNTNLHTITNWHNNQARDLDVSIHFNAFDGSAHGTECLYVTQQGLASKVAGAIATASGLTNRGGKYRSDLFVLNNTDEPAILAEICFCDNTGDSNIYNDHYEDICRALAEAISGQAIGAPPPETADKPPTQPLDKLDSKTVRKVIAAALASPVASYAWRDRGVSPRGYVEGMAMAWTTVMRRFYGGDSSVREMAKANTGDSDVDVLAWYADVYNDSNMDNSKPGIDTLRHLFALMWGLGMRETSGKYCCGRDMSADNVSADTAEAGLYQMSWNARNCSGEMQKLFNLYSSIQDSWQSAEQWFKVKVTCSASNWQSYGSGAGYDYQELAKHCPQFAVETAAVGLRNLRQHWGPINRHEAELRTDVDDLLFDIQELVMPTTV
jgi:hypothetical protein